MDYTLFLEGKIKDNNGRTFDDIFHFSNLQLEVVHNYIQRTFPLDEGSQYDDIEPITKEDIEKFKKSTKAQKNVIKMYDKMLKFWQLNKNKFMEWKFLYPFRHWNINGDHNHKRITRVLKSLKLLGLKKEYNDFAMRIRYIIKLKETNLRIHINDETIKYWEDILK